jgi:hypothetical protein
LAGFRRSFCVRRDVSGADHIIFIGHGERYTYTNRPTLVFCRSKYMRGEPLVPA